MSKLVDSNMSLPVRSDQPESAVRRGDVGAMADLFSIHRDRFAQIVQFRMNPRISSRVDIEDILQEAFLDATKRIKHFVDDSAMSPFVRLREIVLQTLVDVHRRHLGVQARDCSREVSLAPQKFGYDTSICLNVLLIGNLTSPSSAAMHNELSIQIQTALSSMEPIDREVLMMRHFEDLSNKEISQALGIKISAASRRYIRAVKRLGDILG